MGLSISIVLNSPGLTCSGENCRIQTHVQYNLCIQFNRAMHLYNFMKFVVCTPTLGSLALTPKLLCSFGLSAYSAVLKSHIEIILKQILFY